MLPDGMRWLSSRVVTPCLGDLVARDIALCLVRDLQSGTAPHCRKLFDNDYGLSLSFSP